MVKLFAFLRKSGYFSGKLPPLLLVFPLLLLPNAYAQPANVLDASFEGNSGKAPAGWSTWGKTATWSWDSSVGRTGTRSLSISNSRWNIGWAGPSFPVDGSYASEYQCYTLTGWVRADFTTGRSHLTISWNGPNGWICNTNTRCAPTSSNGKWIKLSVMAMPPVGATSGQVFLRSDKNEGTVWFDDVSLQLVELPIVGSKPQQDSSEAKQISPYKCLIRDHAGNALAGNARLALAVQYAEVNKTLEAATELSSFASAFSDSPDLPQAKFQAAEIACAQQSLNAESLLQAIVDNYPKSEYAPLASMKMAYVRAKKGEGKASLQADFSNVANNYPDSLCGMECLYRAARLDLRDPPDYTAHLTKLKRVMELSDDRRLQAEAMVDTGTAHLERHLQFGDNPEDLSKALEILQAVQTQYPEQTNSIARAALRLGRYYLYSVKNIAAAKQVFTDCLSNHPTTAVTELRFQLAYCAYAEKSYVDCVRQCKAIIDDEEVDPGWKAWTGVFLGQCYLEMKDNDSAKATLRSVIDRYPDTQFSEAAQRLLDGINRKAGSGGTGQ